MIAKLLLAFCRENGNGSSSKPSIDTALDSLNRVYPDFPSLVSEKRIVDYGCGAGLQSIALAKKYGCTVVGVDYNPDTLRRAEENAQRFNAPVSLAFVEKVHAPMLHSFDVVISKDSFEHFPDPEQTLQEMASLLTESGALLITFGPPWFAPYGSHMAFFCPIPWVNIIFSEKAVMEARGHFRDDGAMRYEDVESGLNRMSIGRFENIISKCGMRIDGKKYECVKGMNFAGKVPVLREFLINHASVMLSGSRMTPDKTSIESGNSN